MPRVHRATLRITVANDALEEQEIEFLLRRASISPTSVSLAFDTSPAGNKTEAFSWRIQWKGKRDDMRTPPIINELANNPHVRTLEFKR